MTENFVEAAVLAAIADAHGVRAEQVRPISSGVANRAFLLGDDLVLRIPRTAGFVADLRKEASVIPVARSMGVRAPELITFDESTTLADVPFMVLQRAPGADLERLPMSHEQTNDIFHEVGRELAKLHQVKQDDFGELTVVPVNDDVLDPGALLARLRESGHLDPDSAAWFLGWFARLATRLPDNPPFRLLHGDIAPQNLLVLPATARLSGIVDWGDAMWADPAVDFAKTPLLHVPALLSGYRAGSRASASADGEWEARILWYHLLWAVKRLEDQTPRPGERHWTAPPVSRLLGLLRFFAAGPPAPWGSLA